METVLLKIGYAFTDIIEKRETFFARRLWRIILICYFISLSKILKRRKFDLYLRIGTLYSNLKRYGSASSYYGKASILAKDNADEVRVNICLGNLAFSKKSYAEALERYRESLTTARYKTTILSDIAYTYEAMREYKMAMEYAERSIETSRKETDLNHTIPPEENVKALIVRLKEKLPE